MPSTDPDYSKKHYAANKERYLETQRKRRAKNRKWLDEIKNNSQCKYCSENCAVCLDFHHVNGDKVGDISQMIRDKNKIDVMTELEKCVIVCANCHRKIHAGLIHENMQAGLLVD